MRFLLLLFAACSYPVKAEDVARALVPVNQAIEDGGIGDGVFVVPVKVGYLPPPADGYTKNVHVIISDHVSVGNDVGNILLHEYGHSLGLGHVDDVENIMYGGVGAFVDLATGAKQLHDACTKTKCNKLHGMQLKDW